MRVSDTADEAFVQFVRMRGATLMRYGFLLSGSEADAADLLQEALIGLRAKWAQIRKQEAVEAYVRRSMARQYIRIWRRRKREQLVEVPPDRVAPEDPFARVEADDTLWVALRDLGRRQRAVLVLRYYEDLDDDEIAVLLGIARSTVRSQAARGLETLRARLDAHRPAEVRSR
ncbi:SigE family RNA polymerase sigma factor [Dactylosporangium sp. NPDC005555]|uniref:SigE family RNA polymerase sigma factor n=1 Tax=Dactylosporangium sp. NPDC005555 TaxID=3154889 RepID=UPI0033A0C554